MKDSLLKKIKTEGVFYLIVLLSAILFFWPYLYENFTNGAEIAFHYTRVMTLSESLKLGLFPAKLRPMHMKYYGYGIGFFYPDLLIYPPAILIALGAGYDITIKVYEFILILLGGIFSYRCFKEISGKREAAILGEILFMASSINDRNLFDGGGMPHLFAYLALPLALCGILRALKDERGGLIEYVFGMVIVLLTHNMIFLTMFFAIVVMVLIHMGKIIKKPSILLKILGISVLAMFPTAGYYMPMIEQISHIRFIAFYDNAYSVGDHILTFDQLVLGHIGILLFVIFVVTVLLYAWILFKRRTMPLDVTCMLVVNVLTMWLMCSKALWLSSIGEALNFFEYTERFDFVVTVTAIMFIVLVIREDFEFFALPDFEQKKNYGLSVLLISVAVLFIARLSVRPNLFTGIYDNRIQLYEDMVYEEYQVSGAEWLPVECEPSECKTPDTSKADDGSGAEGFKHDNAVYYEVWVDLSKNYYDVPYVYYYGYRAYIVDDAMNPVQELTVGEAFDDNGYVRVFMPEDGEGVGHIMVTYRKTFIQKLSYIISILSTIAIAAGALFLSKRGKRLYI